MRPLFAGLGPLGALDTLPRVARALGPEVLRGRMSHADEDDVMVT